MTIRGLNHITFATPDLPRAVAFYRDTLALTLDPQWETGTYLSAGDLCIFLSFDAAAQAAADYTHVAFDADAADFTSTCARLTRAGAQIGKTNRSESLYFTDPDGHRLELYVGTLASRLAHIVEQQVKGTPSCGT